MKDITKQFFQQSPEYGNRPKENFGRRQSDIWKAERILKLLNLNTLPVTVTDLKEHV